MESMRLAHCISQSSARGRVDHSFGEGSLAVSLPGLPGKAGFTGSVSRRRARACHRPGATCDVTEIHEEIGAGSMARRDPFRVWFGSPSRQSSAETGSAPRMCKNNHSSWRRLDIA